MSTRTTLESPFGKVTLATAHAAKGLEWDHLRLVGCEEGLLPHYRAVFESASPEEERRVGYVALT